jgi:hypothetical protein
MKKLMVIAAVLVFFTGSAYAEVAAEWNFYGSARVSTFYSDIDKTPFVSGNPDTANFEQDLNGNARIGAKVKVNDSLTGRFEYGTEAETEEDIANVRILWGEWDFGVGSLGIGKNYTPLLMPYSNQVYNIFAEGKGDSNMAKFGMLYGDRKAMIRLKFGTFQIALVEPKTMVANYVTLNDDSGYEAGTFVHPLAGEMSYYLADGQPETELSMPAIQVKYKLDFKMGHLNFAGGYQTFDVLDNTEEYSVDSYILALGGRLNLGGFYFKGNVWGGQNVGNLADILVSNQIVSSMDGFDDRDGLGMGFARWSDGTFNVAKGLTDNDALAAMVVVGYEIRKGLYVEAGYGYTSTELDETGSEKFDADTYYLQSTIFLAPGVFLTPEIGVLEVKQDDQAKITYAGIKWQINF